MKDPLSSPTPDQKLSILASEIRTPIEIIRGLAFVIRKNIESNKIESSNILSDINSIVEAADKIKELIDEVV